MKSLASSDTWRHTFLSNEYSPFLTFSVISRSDAPLKGGNPDNKQ